MKRMFYTDRSRIDLMHRCPQARYLAYDWGGTGIRKDTVVWDIVVGLCVHEGLSVLLSSCKYAGSTLGGSLANEFVERAVKSALARLDAELSSTPFDLSELSTESLEPSPSNLYLPTPGKESPDTYLAYLIDETKALIELLVRTYAYAPAGLKWLLDTYEILEVEQEDSFTLANEDEFEIKFMARADGLLRRRIDGALVVLSFKTTKIYESYKEGSAASDMQGMSEVVAIEKRLAEWTEELKHYPEVKSPNAGHIADWYIDANCPKTIEGVQMIYLLTSDSRKDGDGFKRRSSGLLRPWVKRGGGFLGDEYAFTASWVDGEGKNRRLGKDWSRVNAWELDGGIAEYVDMIKDHFDEALGGYPLDSVIVNSQLHRREKDKLERWERETRAQETKVAEALYCIALEPPVPEPYIEEINQLANQMHMDNTFPHHNNACYDFKRPCQFYPICWQSRLYAENPLGSGYKRREPHHPIEMEALVQIEKKG